MPPEKKRRLEDSIESKLSQIRHKVDESQNATTTQTPKSKKNKKKRKSNDSAVPANQLNSTPNPPAEFDYSNVDFKSFAGGSQKSNGQKEFKSKFKGKGKVSIMLLGLSIKQRFIHIFLYIFREK